MFLLKDVDVSLTSMDASVSENNFFISQGYHILSIIGKGSYAKVFLCGEENSSEKRAVACKVVDIRISKADFIYKFFPRELEILRALKHPNIIELFGILKKDDKYFIFMRYAENNDLLEYVVTNGQVPEPKVRFWAWQIASALSFMHSKDIVHRDLKCENILLTAHSNVKICDFGFGKILSKGESLSQTWCGSLAYSPPEILEMRPYHPKKVDSWAMGVIFYVTLSKRLPFHEKSPRALLAKQKRRILFTGKSWDDVTQYAKNSLMKLLEVDPKYRWTPDNVLECSWLSEDPRLVHLSLNALKQGPHPESPLDRQRLSVHLKESSRSSGFLSSKVTSTKIEESFDYFEKQEIPNISMNQLRSHNLSNITANSLEQDDISNNNENKQ